MKFLFVIALIVGVVTAARQENPTTPDHLTCDEGDDLVSPPDCPPEDENGLPSYFPFKYDCRKYFECTNGIARCLKCGPGTVWDQDLLTCNHESVSPCVIVTTPPPTTSTTTTTPPPTTTTPTTTTTTTTPTTPTTTTPTTTTTTTEVPTTTEDPANWICPEGYVGRMAHPYSCRLFYICDPGRRPCLFECPANLYFNPITLDCDWPSNIPSCQGGTPPPPTNAPQVNYRTVKRFHIKEKANDDGGCDGLSFEYY